VPGETSIVPETCPRPVARLRPVAFAGCSPKDGLRGAEEHPAFNELAVLTVEAAD